METNDLDPEEQPCAECGGDDMCLPGCALTERELFAYMGLPIPATKPATTVQTLDAKMDGLVHELWNQSMGHMKRLGKVKRGALVEAMRKHKSVEGHGK